MCRKNFWHFFKSTKIERRELKGESYAALLPPFFLFICKCLMVFNLFGKTTVSLCFSRNKIYICDYGIFVLHTCLCMPTVFCWGTCPPPPSPSVQRTPTSWAFIVEISMKWESKWPEKKIICLIYAKSVKKIEKTYFQLLFLRGAV